MQIFHFSRRLATHIIAVGVATCAIATVSAATTAAVADSHVLAPIAPIASTLVETELFHAQRQTRYMQITLKQPHQVLSTSSGNGGQSDRIQYLVNHQSMEGSNHSAQFEKILSLSPDEYHASVAADLQLEPSLMALMGTAANMQNTAHAVRTYKDLRIDAFVTAGVHGNALRAGDRAQWAQGEDGNHFVEQHGTINIMVLVNRPMLSGALSKAAMIITEAKSSVLQELAIGSRVSQHIATGTGTDQLIIAAVIDESQTPLKSASGHLKTGELVGDVVRAALFDALKWQSGLERSRTRNILHAMQRFGLDEETLMSALEMKLPAHDYSLLSDNRNAMLHDTRLVAAAFAYAAILDRLEYGTFSPVAAQEILKDQAANVAVGLSTRTRLWPDFWQQIEVDPEKPTEAFVDALALGWQAKWRKSP